MCVLPKEPPLGLFMCTKASCQCVERVIRSGEVIVTWGTQYPIVGNWLRNILQLSSIFLLSQLIVPLDMVDALNCAATFPFTVNSTSSFSVAFCATGVGHPSLPAHTQVSSPLPLPCSISLGVMFGWAGMAVLIRLTSVLCIVVVTLH